MMMMGLRYLGLQEQKNWCAQHHQYYYYLFKFDEERSAVPLKIL
jgi:hypothetical protein